MKATTEGIIEKYSECLNGKITLEEEVAKMSKREVALLSQLEGVEKMCASEKNLREVQGKLVEATTAENELIKKSNADLVERHNSMLTKYKEAILENTSLDEHIKSVMPRIDALSAEYKKSLDSQVKSSEKVCACVCVCVCVCV